MTKRYENKKHLDFVRNKPCALWEAAPKCEGQTQVHHLLKPWSGERGMGLKANDRNVIPLCQAHHTELHDKVGDEEAFFQNYELMPSHGRETAAKLWLASPFYEGMK